MYWTRNNHIIDDLTVNIRFSELLAFTDEQVVDWVRHMRSRIVEVWNQYGCPPMNGKDSREEIIDDLTALSRVFTPSLNPSLDQEDIIINNSHCGSSASQFFPTMLKTKINYDTGGDGRSIYDYFADGALEQSMLTGCRRHFRRDSFYMYSQKVAKASFSKSAFRWLESNRDASFWLQEITTETKGTGYTERDNDEFLTLTSKEVQRALKNGLLSRRHMTNVDEITPDSSFSMRVYDPETRIFPDGFRAFRLGYIQVAVNFPPPVAKYLYQKYTAHLKGPAIVYDPSSGWGGRIAGAMSVDARQLHYVGTDPNSDNFGRYEALANFYNKHLVGIFGTPNTFEIFRHGSEVIGKDRKFRKYIGKVDVVFTSPPYFNREGYSDDPEQSLNKFPIYQDWKAGFLRPTLETAVRALKPGGYLLWNIADILVKGEYIPLEDDSKKILEELGMGFVREEKMCLANMPGQNRVDDEGKPNGKHVCRVKLKGVKRIQWRKYEPIFVWRKP